MVSGFDTQNYSGSGPMPIGHPINNTRLYVLDSQSLEPLPIGVPGELFISGVGLASGYIGQPELTAERFLTNPFQQPGDDDAYARMYRSGDIVSWLPDGTLKYIGRADTQVKLRGFRLELGEIEAVLAAVEGVQDAVVVVQVCCALSCCGLPEKQPARICLSRCLEGHIDAGSHDAGCEHAHSSAGGICDTRGS